MVEASTYERLIILHLHAKNYCEFIEVHQLLNVLDFVQSAAVRLANIYAMMLSLPENSDTADEDVHTESAVPREMVAQLAREISAKLGSYNVYRLVVHPYIHDEQIEFRALSDDLVDIYDELKIIVIPNNMTRSEVIEELKFSFNTHWGAHLVNALHALHALMTEDLVAEGG